jgi:hypothetical protein
VRFVSKYMTFVTLSKYLVPAFITDLHSVNET